MIRSQFAGRLSELRKIRREQGLSNKSPLSIVILGAGPAGLIHALVSLLRGHRTVVIEKRAPNCPGRYQVLSVARSALKILNRYGLDAYLVEKVRFHRRDK